MARARGARAPHVIHVVATREFAGVERYLTYVAPLLAEAGWRVTVVGGQADKMREVLEPAGVEHVEYRNLAQLTAWLARYGRRADVIHTHMTAAELAATLTLPITRAAFVTTRHFAARRGSSMPARLAGRVIARVVRVQISISQFVADSIGEPSVVIPHGVPDQPLGSHDRKVVLVAQRLQSEKRTDVAIRAWAASGLAGDGWTMEIAGDGALREDLERLADDLGMADSVRFLGFVPDLSERLARASLFLATTPIEALGLSVVEAMATGCAVVAADGGAHRETLTPELGALFPVNHVAGCAALLSELAADVGLRQSRGTDLWRRQREVYSLASHSDSLLTLYQRLKSR